MQIIELEISGYRSLKNVKWAPDNLNVLIGPNGAGKSNLLGLIELLSVSANSRLSSYVQRMGGMEPLVWDGTATAIDIRIKCTPLGKSLPNDVNALTYHCVLERIGAGSSFRIGYELLGNYYKMDRGVEKEPFKFLERRRARASIYDSKVHILATPDESIPEEETLLSMSAGPFSRNKVVSDFQTQLSSWSVYHDFRTDQNAAIRQPVVTKSDLRVDPDGQNLISVLHTHYSGDRDFQERIDAAMVAAYGSDYVGLVFAPAADQRIQLRIRWKTLSRDQSAAELSDGTLRFLTLLTILLGPSSSGVIAIDEPETGLHPGMLPIIAEHAVDASRNTQIIFTTHSPQFLDAFQDTYPTTTVVDWKEGMTTVRKIEGESLRDWLKEFSLGSLFDSGELETIE